MTVNPLPPFPTVNGYILTEHLYQGTQTAIYRAVAADIDRSIDGKTVEDRSPTVIIKLLQHAYPSLSDLIRFRNQYIVTRHLTVTGVVHPIQLQPWQNAYALVMEDVGSISLDEYARLHAPLSVQTVMAIALQLADILKQLCQQQVVHKDINPTNILIHPDTGQVRLIDFSLASLLPYETQTLKSPSELEGTLAYMSPEQTGRMNRGIDYRTDFYGLGVTLYQLLTGSLPFPNQDPIELVHCHIAREPVPLYEMLMQSPREQQRSRITSPRFKTLDLTVLKLLSDITLKLMAKNAEDRYQSGAGLKYDLEQCLRHLNQTSPPDRNPEDTASFKLGQRDVSDRFSIPEKLYGRASEVETLLKSFTRVTAGDAELMLVVGGAGLGKTAIIHEVHKPITRQHGYFVQGKFDQFQRSSPFSGFIQAFRRLINQLLGETDQRLSQWKTKIQNAVGHNGQLLIAMIPEIERIIGPQPTEQTPGQLGETAKQTLFNLLFCRFVQIFASSEHPLVIFLDDLHWVDSASLSLLKQLMTNPNMRHLLVLGAYRDNEVFSAHPLMLTLAEIEKKRATLFSTLTLAPLPPIDIDQLVADTLRCPIKSAIPLSQLVYQKTQGNPFFTIQFLQGLHRDGWISIESSQQSGLEQHVGGWQCDLAKVRSLTLTDDVLQFMTNRLQKLPATTQYVLQMAACMGNPFDLHTLALACQIRPGQIVTELWQALQEGLIIPKSEIYKFFQGDAPALQPAESFYLEYQFLHDRVQQAAYALIPDDRKGQTHLSIGQRLLDPTANLDVNDRLFDIIHHLNQGRDWIDDPQQRLQLADLNLKTGQKARDGTAYHTAFDCARIGIDFLPDNCWQQHYDLTLALYQEGCIAARLVGEFDALNRWSNIATSRCQTLMDRVPFYETQIQALVAQKQLTEAVQLGLETLAHLGETFPAQPSQEDISQGIQAIATRLDDHSIDSLIDLPTMTDPRSLAVLRVLWRLSSVLVMTASKLMPICTMRAVEISIQKGNSILSAPAYVTYGMILCGVVGDIPSGFSFGQLALRVVDKYGGKMVQAKTIVRFMTAVHHWQQPLQDSLESLAQGYRLALEAGDLESASLCAGGYGYQSYFAGKELGQLEREMAVYSQGIQAIQQQTTLYWNEIYRQHVRNLLGQSEDPCRLVGEAYDETIHLPMQQQYNDQIGVAIAHLFKAIACYHFERYDQAIDDLAIATEHQQAFVAFVFTPSLYFYTALAHLSLMAMASCDSPEGLPPPVQQGREKFRLWSAHGPMNYQHKADLIEAECCRVLGRYYEAGDRYDRAIEAGKAAGYSQDEALANERAAQFYLAWGKDKVAAGYMQEAYYCYARWGAKAKTDDLEERYPQLLAPVLQQNRHSLDPLEALSQIADPSFTPEQSFLDARASSSSISNAALDFVLVLRAAQRLAKTLDRDDLLRQLSQIILQQSGGDRCALVLPDLHGIWSVAAIATPETTTLCAEPLENHPHLPVHLIQYVKNTQEVLVVDDVETSLPIVDDYWITEQPKSLLGLPILSQGQLMGVLYVSNQTTRQAFTGDRLVILHFLCIQAAISLENAQLYHQTKESEARAKQLFEQASDAIILHDEERILDCNAATLEFFNRSKEELLTMHPGELAPAIQPDGTPSQQKAVQIIALAIEHGTQRFEWCYQTGDRTMLWAEVVLTPLRYGDKYIFHGVLRDISERKRIASALELSEARATAAFSQATIGIVESNMQTGQLTLVNSYFCEMTGYSESELLKMTVADLTHSEDMLASSQSIQQLYAEHKYHFTIEKRYVRKDSSWFWAQTTVYTVRFQDRPNTACLALVQDISQRKQLEAERHQAEAEREKLLRSLSGLNAELEKANQELAQYSQTLELRVAERTAELEANRAYYQAIVADQTELICRFLPDGKPTFVNEAYRQFFQISASGLADLMAALEQETETEEVHEDNRDRAFSHIRVLFSTAHRLSPDTPVETYEQNVVGPDNTEHWHQWTVRALLEQDNVIEFQAVGRDITPLKEAGMIIQQQLNTIEASIDGLGILRDGQYVFVNQSQVELFGYGTPDDLLGQSWRFLYDSQDIQRFEQEVFPQVEQHGFWRGEAMGKRRNGQRFPVEVSLTLTPTGDIIRVCRDIGDRKRAEEKIRQSMAQLETSNQELESFAYSVSHDLRAPLRAIDGFSQALLEDYNDFFNDEGRDYFDRIRSNIIRMGSLIDDLLRLSRVSRSELRYETVNLSTIVREWLHDTQRSEPERQVDLILTAEAIVSADAALMQVVLTNLLDNAWKFTSHHPTARIEFGTIQNGKQRVYFVRDDGAGFDMVYAKKLFGVFQRLHSIWEFPGTGIGLATVQRAIHRHGGQVWAEAAVEKGAVFYFTIPTLLFKSE
ncbi:MAG: PAS domain S-box protein [Cyanobacteria bacterium P01_F01_bin.13]